MSHREWRYLLLAYGLQLLGPLLFFAPLICWVWITGFKHHVSPQAYSHCRRLVQLSAAWLVFVLALVTCVALSWGLYLAGSHLEITWVWGLSIGLLTFGSCWLAGWVQGGYRLLKRQPI
ncbi:hypothetical protein BFW38_14200 [Terasakiispira papahanaumokuakeensis]|uniref:DUF4870 domain-containing protein n=1 Tax=Terasakiispira papahanaumokuakeensis TaxID=197479 RepID=A0A1E2VC03_9GAMM|nr:hypothetical protein [Terasakiispira papahanaumokuakeensis]ODC04511.1 hypothetical protein BFW38_14200 [Terasakiispira papahanaumokuakeensis]